MNRVKALGIDYGTKRIGIAGCDALGITVTALEVVMEPTPERAVARIAAVAKDRDAQVLVFGLPVNMDGTEHKSARAVRAFAEKCAAATALPIEYVDERLTTMQADRQLREHGLTRKGRKQRVDKAAAALLLRHWLDSRR